MALSSQDQIVKKITVKREEVTGKQKGKGYVFVVRTTNFQNNGGNKQWQNMKPL